MYGNSVGAIPSQCPFAMGLLSHETKRSIVVEPFHLFK